MSAPESLGDRAARAARWRFASSIGVAAARFAVGVLLSRLLRPADFGLVALALVATAVAQPIADLGIGGAIVQRRDLTPRHIRAAFTLATALGAAVAAALVLGAPLAAFVMRDARVAPILRALSITFLIQGTATTAAGLLRRQLEFKRLFLVEMLSYGIGYGAVGLALATSGAGVWSLVAGSLCQSAAASALLLLSARHSMRPLFSGSELRDILHFGIGAGAGTWINYVAVNADNFIVGRTLGAASLGLYARAYTLMNLPYTYVASVMSGVLFPALAQMQDDVPRLRRAYLLMTEVTALVAASSAATMAVAAPHLVRALYGPQWSGVAVPLQILCAAGYFRALYHVGGVFAYSVGRVYSDLRRQLIYAALVVGGAIVGARSGLAGVAVGVSIAIVVMFGLTGQLAAQITGSRWREYFSAQSSAAAIAFVAGACALAVRVMLERSGASSAIVAMGTVGVAGVIWVAGAAWTLSDPRFHAFVARLPRRCAQIVGLFGSRGNA